MARKMRFSYFYYFILGSIYPISQQPGPAQQNPSHPQQQHVNAEEKSEFNKLIFISHYVWLVFLSNSILLFSSCSPFNSAVRRKGRSDKKMCTRVTDGETLAALNWAVSNEFRIMSSYHWKSYREHQRTEARGNLLLHLLWQTSAFFNTL